MERHWTYFFVFLWFSYLFFTAVLLFTRGFLLNREVIPQRAKCKATYINCNESNNYLHNSSHSNEFNSDLQLQCNEDKVWMGLNNSVEEPMTCQSSKAKVVLIVIDALKFDFVYFDEKLKSEELLPYQNKLTVINELLTKEPNHTKLFKFIADPPTTTMQRLKGLTTGSLPTFIDVGSNFATPEINEDNIIDQLRHQNKNIVFMGDDTWSGLYPKRFIREYSYPSFNVWDLDTVDNGIMNHLLPEIVKKDWSLLIAHFLGVDHCGHRYGPYHSEMSRKLMEMNEMIRSVVDTIDDNTILFVIGDHGMTNTGDHGGDSDAEVTAAMFVFSPKPLLSADIAPRLNVVNQVDLVPTLSTILGLPIPFSNLGAVILDSLPSMIEGKNSIFDWKFALKTVWENVHQTMKYIKQYSQSTNQFSQEKFNLLEKNFTNLLQTIKSVSRLEDFVKFSSRARSFLLQVRQMCEEVWVQFDLVLMCTGLFIIFVSILFLFMLVDVIPGDQLQETLNKTFLSIVYGNLLLGAVVVLACYMLDLINNLEIAMYVSTGALSIITMAVVIAFNWAAISNLWFNQSKFTDWPSAVGKVLLLLSLCGLFSNSYVVEEATVLSYFFLTMIWLLIYCYKPSKQETISRGTSKASEKQSTLWWYNKYLLTPLRLKLAISAVLLSALMRASHYYWLCREEQLGCESFATKKAHSFVDFVNLKYCSSQSLFTLICLAFFVTIARIWLRSCGNLVGFSPIVTLSRYTPTIVVVCTGGFWALQNLPKDTKSKLFVPWQIQLLPWIIYFIVSIALLTLAIQPLSIYMIPKKKDNLSFPVYGQANIIPHLFSQMKELIRGRKKSSTRGGDDGIPKDLPIVYGLATVYSSVFVNVAVFIGLLIALLLGDALAPSVVLMYAITVVLILILAAIQYEKVLFTAQLFSVPWSSVFCWGFLTVYFFYGTGHTATFPGIQWEAAFVGTTGQFSNHIVPALLICINTFASHIVLSLLLPVLLVAPFTLHVMFPKILPSAIKDGAKSKDIKRGELFLYQRDDLLYQGSFNLFTKYILFFGIRMFTCMLAAAVHSRHLMVWKIFAPKFIFEGLGFFATLICVLMSYLFVIRITKQVEKLLLRLEKEHR